MAKELSYIDYECYIFDFDGVILNSNLVKENAIEIAGFIYVLIIQVHTVNSAKLS